MKIRTMMLIAAWLGSGCSAPAEQPPASEGPPVNPLGRPRCVAPEGFAGSPATTEEAVQLLNALPKPTSVACFVEALERPLGVFATASPFSAQPAFSKASPRVFIQLGQLWASVVVDGPSSYLLEFGYRPPEADMTSIKGELELPLHDVIPLSAPYDRVRSGEGTNCGLCHYGEARAAHLDFAEAFASVAFRPRPESRVDIAALQAQSQGCDWSVTPNRCEMLSALFDGGVVSESLFPDAMPTFY